MLAFSRFSVPPQEQASFLLDAERAAAWFAGRPGCRYAEVVGNLDEPDLFALASGWDDVGSYRRAFNGYDAKMILMPVLNRALDEPSAWASPTDVGLNVPRIR
jgi:hypothetical protein